MLINYLFITFVAAGAASDLLFRKVFNVSIIAAVILGLGANLLYGGMPGLGSSLLGLLAGFAFLFPFYLLGGIGAGDVKFLAACGAITGFKFLMWGTLYGAIFGGVYSIILLTVNRRALATLKEVVTGVFLFLTLRSRRSIEFDKSKAIHIPYVVFLAGGLILRWLELSGVK
jgi:prepilin peptidase CpaA